MKQAAIGHGVPGVHGEVHKNLYELDPVRPDSQQPWRQLCEQFHILSDQPLQKVEVVLNHAVHIEDNRPQTLATAEGQELSRQVSRSPGRLVDAVELGRRIAVEPLSHQIHVPDDNGEQVVEVVSDATGETADRFHFLGLTNPLLQRVTCTHVDPATHQLYRFTFVVQNHLGPHH